MDLVVVELHCPFREVTGLPCPFCGGTRAFLQVAQLHSSFLQYNAVWVFVAALLAIAGAVGLVLRQVSPARFAAVRAAAEQTSNRVRLSIVVLVVGIAWAWALAHRGTIVN